MHVDNTPLTMSSALVRRTDWLLAYRILMPMRVSQLVVPDFSNRVARNGKASGPSSPRAIASKRQSQDSSATVGFLIKCRAPARLRATVTADRASIKASHSVFDKQLCSIA